MAAQFLVTRYPGADVKGVGFVRAGQFFTAPAGTIPSRFFRAMNQEAVDDLKKLKAALQKVDAEKLALYQKANIRDGFSMPIVPPQLAGDVNLELFEQRVEEPVVRESGLTVRELGEVAGGVGHDRSPKSKRVADA